MTLRFFAHASFQIRTDDGQSIVIDPWLDANPLSSVKSKDVSADYILLTHAHGDHCGDTLKIADKDTIVVAVSELAGYFKEAGCKTHAIQIGGAHNFSFGTVRFVKAEHGSMTPDGRYGGLAAGIIITINGYSIYHMGDTGLFGDLKLIGDMQNIDCLLVPIGGNYTMDPSDAAMACSWLKPRFAIPMHYNTFPVIKQDPALFANACKERGISVKIMQPGESISL
ncbi:MAG: metal-dependent hydrolase [Candidatus Cloacimonadales bacterium]|jgi:L-ascorbate metabolism protein UlaG (beta-lactamase superfamily)|nr:metal-dependent hydrolase [Candidatus Cloacimonadota bacterium]MDY0381141.1 metal-dependent hydrolase [Candidatus Cloacimonadaceae bacterium]HCM16114.1 metal-dependent hydrolase [Candidatus Cloacimonas sp.]MCB5256040.1 metal-dependent hydrolase [Candidatus Cloacimonadota bacterium]MCB5263278.1 metal-dependent hydrolase [Candidatus Cloacimonadota bacterium]